MYFYHGYALGVASTIPGNVFTQCTCALSVAGGVQDQTVTNPESPLISFDSIKSHVSGNEIHPFEEGCLDAYATEASVVIKNLKIKDKPGGKDRITAALVQARIRSQHWTGDYDASTVVCGSKFEGLQVDGKELKIVLSNDLSEQYSTFSAMQLDFMNGFSRNAVNACLVGRDLKEADANTEDLRAAYDAYQEQIVLPRLKSAVVSSFIAKVDGGGLKTWGPIVAIPDLGNLYLGEVIVWPWMRCLTMFRLELLSGGTICGGSAGSNGTGWPPGSTPPDWP